MAPVDEKALIAEVDSTIVSEKGNYCPIVIRNAWHASGTFDKADSNGGSDGATMRFEPELSDRANVGLTIVHDLLAPIKEKFPDVSLADLWTLAGARAVKLAGGPEVPFGLGRTDKDVSEAPSCCPANGRLPAPILDADGLRGVFGRMGLDDRDIVSLSGGHTLGECKTTRSGFMGPWTKAPLKFDNEYYNNLLNMTWTKKEWEGPPQYVNEDGSLMMLMTDIALLKDPAMLEIVKEFAADEQKFFEAFASAYGKLMSLGCPAHCQK